MLTSIALAASVLLTAAAAEPTRLDVGQAALITAIEHGERTDAGEIQFTTWEPGVGFAIQPDDEAQTAAIFAGLRDASETARSFTVRFARGSGVLIAGTPLVRFRACAIGFASGEIVVRGGACAGTSAPGTPLSRGVAAAALDEGAAAVPLLTQALGDASLPREGQLVAVRARERAWNALATGAAPGTKDRELIAALADARRWAELASDDADARLAEAADLAALGAYDEAVRAYAAIVRHWPDEDYRASVRIGAIRRALGDDAGALAALDGLVARHGDQAGMKFHYHRGWTLTNLDRNEEAVAEFSKGLKDQPDYSWAFIRRACALGKVGRIVDAAADQHRGVAAFEAFVATRTRPDPDVIRMRARAGAVAAALDAMARTDPTGMTDVACTGYPDQEPKRARSTLLPRAAS